jgi:hypothetical protein
MRFSGGALAILGASNDGTTDRHRTGRHHRSSMMSSRSNSVTPPITNRTTNRQQQTGAVTTSAITNLQRLREIVECDPTTPISGNALTEERRLRGRGSNTNSEYHDGTSKMTANTKDDDFGILDRSNTNSFITFTSACGVGRKCQDVSTSTSKSSGLCVDVEGWNHRNLQQKGSAGTSENDIYGYAFATGKLDEMQYLCDYGDLVGYDCECNFNENDYTGSGACNITDTGNDEFCTTTTSMCDVSIENCYSSTYRVTLVPSSSSSSDATGSWDAEVCSHFSEPYGQTVCYTTRNTITSSDNNDAEEATTSSRNPYGCSISIDGETCTSCEIAESRSNDDDEETCYAFDCRNTQAGMNGISKVGNTCDYPVFPLSLYLDTYGCPTCNLCDISDGMTLPDSTIMVAGSDTAYVCSTVAEIAGLGFFTTDTCKYFANLATDSCGCISSSASSITYFTIAAIDAIDAIDAADADADVDVDAAAVDRTSAPVVTAAVDSTSAPVADTIDPTMAPVDAATSDPTTAPVVATTNDPTMAPVVAATSDPTTAPVVATTNDPTTAPVVAATSDPTSTPVAATNDPTSAPVAAAVDSTSAPVSDPPTPAPIVPEVTTEAPTADSPQKTDAPIVVVAADAATDDEENDYPVGNITEIFEGLDDAFEGPDGTDTPSYPMIEPPVIITQEEIDDGVIIDEPSVLDTGTYDATAENDDISSRNDVTTGDSIDRTSTTNNDEEDDAEQEQVDDINVYGMNNYCSPCGPRKNVFSSKYDDNEVSIPTQGIFTCKELNEVAKQRSFNPICSLVQLAANVPCGCKDYDEEEYASTTATATKSADTDTDTDTGADADASSSSSSTTSVDSTTSAAASGTAINLYSTFFIVVVVTPTIMIASLSL